MGGGRASRGSSMDVEVGVLARRHVKKGTKRMDGGEKKEDLKKVSKNARSERRGFVERKKRGTQRGQATKISSL